MSNQTQKVIWLLYHEPVDLFLRTANAFSKEIKERTNGRVDIEIYTLSEYADKFHNGVAIDPTALIASGEVQMSQTQVAYLGLWGAEDFYALELPFLFSTHEHATRVLEGEIGAELLNSLPATTPVRGLAFTYSGGFRAMASRTPITSADSFKGLEMSVRSNPIFTDTARAFGCETTPAVEHEWDHNQVIRSNTDIIQTTLPRYVEECDPAVHGYVTNTEHSMYLTSIVIGEKFWNTLSIADQLAFRESAMNVARLERTWTVDDSVKIESDLSEQQRIGIRSINRLPAEEIAKLKEAVEPLYTKYSEIFTPGLVESIRRA